MAEAGYLGYLKAKERGVLGKVQYEESLERWKKENKHCKECNKIIPYNKRHNSFCSQTCAAIFNNKKKKVETKCLSCGKIVNWGIFYCSKECQHEYHYKKYIQEWKNRKEKEFSKSFIRRYLFEKYNGKCSICGWDKINPVSKKCSLEIEHIDGNSQNNKEENLTLLCPNCHSLTPTYKALNKGNGRHWRMKRYREGKSY